MKAFILAAGLGTRLKPLTNDRPKALVEIQGKSLLELVIRKLQAVGINDFIVNIHHFGDLVIKHLKEHKDFGANIVISDERETLLDTGGGIKKIAPHLEPNEDFLVHNVDVITDLNIEELIEFHKKTEAVATLAMRKRKTSRYLQFDSANNLCAWFNAKTKERKEARQTNEELHALAFSGIHVINSRIFDLMEESGVFSIIDVYLRLAKKHRIACFDHTDSFWKDLGRFHHWEEMNSKALELNFLREIIEQKDVGR